MATLEAPSVEDIGGKALSRVQSLFDEAAPRYILGVRGSAVFETLLFLGIGVLLSFVFGDGSRFWGIYPHPFWIILLLVTVQYGTNEALMCALLCSITLLAWNLPVQELTENTYDYLMRASYRPLLWFATAVVLGQLRDRHITERRALKQELKDATEREQTITDAYLRLKQIKEVLETRLVGNLQSTSQAYHAFCSIESLNQDEILANAENLVQMIMHPRKFSIFSLGADGFEAITCVGWEDNAPYSRRFSMESPLYEEIISKARLVCIINDADRQIIGGEGLMAAPLIDMSTGEIFGMLKIEDLDFMEVNLSNIENFKALAEVIGTAYANAGRFQQAESYSVMDMDNHLLSYHMFKAQRHMMQGLSRRNKLPSLVIKVTLDNAQQYCDEEKFQIGEAFGKMVKESLGDMAEVYDGKDKHTEYIIMLPGVDEEKSSSVFAMIESGKQDFTQLKSVSYTFNAEVL